MSDREVDLDALFDRNADTQLLDRRRREELGLVAQLAPASATPARFGPESMLAEEPPPRPRQAMLRVALDARPERELIPGAVVTVVASVHDDGDADAPNVLLRIVVPAECEPLPGSFARDDAALDGDALLGEGLRIGTVAARDAVRVRFAMRVLPGIRPLDVIVHASAPGVPTIAAPALRLRRRAGHAAFDAPRPFFELEAGETDELLTPKAAAAPPPPRTVDTVVDEPAAPAVLAPEVVVAKVIVPDVVVKPDVVVAPEIAAPAAVTPEVVAPKAVVKSVKSEVVAPPKINAPPKAVPPKVAAPPEAPAAPHVIGPAIVVVKRDPPKPAAEQPVAPEPKPASKPPRARKPAKPRAKKAQPEPARPHVLARTLDDDTMNALERVFTGAVPHGLAALALLSSIAAVDGPLGDALGVRAFAHTISAAVPRALVAARMNRPAPTVVTRESLATIRAFALTPQEPFAQDGPLLVTRLDDRDLGALRTVLERDLDDTFLRGVQVLLAVAPRALDGVAPDAGARVGEALAAYRVAAGAWLMRVTVRRAVDRRYDPLVASDASLHEAGRALVASLRAALA